jgi:hypothetical protein
MKPIFIFAFALEPTEVFFEQETNSVDDNAARLAVAKLPVMNLRLFIRR